MEINNEVIAILMSCYFIEERHAPVVYILIGLILCFVLYIAFRAINTGMEAKKAKKDLENVDDVIPNNQEDIVKRHEDLYFRYYYVYVRNVPFID